MRLIHSWTLALGITAISIASSSGAAAQAAAKAPDSTPIAVDELPDSPGTTWARLQDTSQQNGSGQSTSAPAAPQSAAPTQDQPTVTQGQSNSQEQPKLQRPVGTAAAEAPKVSGITAAQPAGVAIAPAKQRRVRILVLKVGAILGAGAAIGTVVALSAATPSKPPGAH